MLHFGTDPESYITEYTLVYKEKKPLALQERPSAEPFIPV